MILWLSAVALGQGENALDPATRQHFRSAQQLQDVGRLDSAIAAYRLVLLRTADFVPAQLGMAHCLARKGDWAAAQKLYESLPYETEAILALAEHHRSDHPEKALVLYERLEGLDHSIDVIPQQVRILTETDPEEAWSRWQVYAGGLLEGDEPPGDVLVSLAAALWQVGREGEAVQLLRGYVEGFPGSAMGAEATSMLERWAVEEQARQMGLGASEALGPAERKAIAEARSLAGQGKVAQAREILESLLAEHESAAEAWGALGDVHLGAGDVAEAERAYLWAAALAPESPEWQAQLGLLYMHHYGGRRHEDAWHAFRAALALRPTWNELNYHLGRVAQRLDRWQDAAAAFSTFLEAGGGGAMGEDARARLSTLQRVPPEAPELVIEALDGRSEQAQSAYRIARVYHRARQWQQAEAELLPVLQTDPDWPAALNLAASLRQAQGDEPGAVVLWQDSLEADPGQGLVRIALAEAHRRKGALDIARDEHRRAAESTPDAHYYLAQMAWNAGDAEEAQRHLALFMPHNRPDRMLYAKANALEQLVQKHFHRRQMAMWMGAGSLGGLVILLVGRRLFRGHGLSRLTERAPDAVGDVVRILSAIRHEVLKHNTTLLPEIADALDNGDLHAVSWAAVRLFGDDGTPGIVARFEAYLRALERLGRRQGVRLDLRRRDPMLAPMWRGLRSLKKLEKSLRRPWNARPGTAVELRRIAGVLNEEGYDALGRFIRQAGALHIGPDWLKQVDDRVRSEPGFEDRVLPTCTISGPELPVRVLAGDLEDIAANLLRNAYAALEGHADPHLGVNISEDADPITGIEEVVLGFFDNAAGRLTEEMIRSRNVGRGLGLLTELVARHDGTIAVQPNEEGKTIEVRLPRAEEAA